MKRVKVQPCPACGGNNSLLTADKRKRLCWNTEHTECCFVCNISDWNRLSLAVQAAEERYRLYLESDNPIFEFRTKQEIAYAKFQAAEVERQGEKRE